MMMLPRGKNFSCTRSLDSVQEYIKVDLDADGYQSSRQLHEKPG